MCSRDLCWKWISVLRRDEVGSPRGEGLAVEVETLCKQYALALQIGTPRVLEAEEIDKTIEKFKGMACGGSHARPRIFDVCDKSWAGRAALLPITRGPKGFEGSCRGYYCSNVPT